MCSYSTTTTGYRLADGRYFIVKREGRKIGAILQVFFGCGIYPAPVKNVQEDRWPEVLALVKTQKISENQLPIARGLHQPISVARA